MTVKTTLSFTERHARFLKRQVEAGVYATTSAAVAAAVEQMIGAEEERATLLAALREEIAARMRVPDADWLDFDTAMAEARARLTTGRS